MALILAVQVLLPLALLAWLALVPAGSVICFGFQAAGTGAVLLALAKVAQWAVLGWWLPSVYAGLWLGAAVAVLLRKGVAGMPLFAAGARGWSAAVVSFVLLGIGGWYAVQALIGRALPPVEVMDVANPFGPGRYLVGHGGSNTLVNGYTDLR